jgi:SAM-dependent methyltransferase
MKFKSNDEYIAWIKEQDWYQTIPLSCGIKTKGKFRTDIRESFFSKIDFRGKRVLDIGCNSGQYCFMAKRMGASEVVGLDINKKRLEQARIINENEGLDICFLEKDISEASSLGKFDIVLCIAVFTEISDIIGSIQAIKSNIKDVAFIEMDIARPLIYLPSPMEILRKKKSTNIFADARKSKNRWMISPSIGLLRELFGSEFKLKDRGKSVRYRMIEVRKI